MYGFDYPPDQAGDDDRPHTAFFRELDISNDWAQWWLGIGGRAGRRGHDHATTLDARSVPSGTASSTGMARIALDTTAGAGDTLEPTQNATTGADEPRAKAPTRLRHDLAVHSSAIRSGGVPPGAGRGRLQHGDRTRTAGRSSPRATPSRSASAWSRSPTRGPRNELVRRMMAPPAAGRRPTRHAPTVTWLRPGDGATVNAADPVEIEVEAVDERGDIKEVRLSVGGTQVARKVSFPFQMRWQPDRRRHRRDGDAVGRRRGQGRQRHDVHADHHGRRGVGDGGGAAAHGRDDPLRQAGGRRDADLPAVRVLRQRRGAHLRVAARRGRDRRCDRGVLRPDRRRHRPRRELPRDGDQQRRRRGLHVGRGDGRPTAAGRGPTADGSAARVRPAPRVRPVRTGPPRAQPPCRRSRSRCTKAKKRADRLRGRPRGRPTSRGTACGPAGRRRARPITRAAAAR